MLSDVIDDMRNLNNTRTIDWIGQSLYIRKPVLDLLQSRINEEEAPVTIEVAISSADV